MTELCELYLDLESLTSLAKIHLAVLMSLPALEWGRICASECTPGHRRHARLFTEHDC